MNPVSVEILKGLGRYLGGGALRLIAGDEGKLTEIAETMLRDETEDAEAKLSKLPAAERKVWRARARAALIGLDAIIARVAQ